jgi:hypothetical protein
MEGRPLFVAAFNVADDKLAEFEEWYVRTHVPDGLHIPHFTRVMRYEKFGSALPLTESGPRFLNMYVIDDEANIEESWMSKEREAASQDFFRWAPALSGGVQGIYVPKAVIDRKE